jgi:hypothetical protein
MNNSQASTAPTRKGDAVTEVNRPILVTGAAGRVGGAGHGVVEMLRKRKLPVRAFVHREDERADSTKGAMHSYSQSLRYRLDGTSVKVQEIAPPWVQTLLLNSNNEPRAMPLPAFIEETMKALATDANEVLVEIARPLRNNPGPNEAAFVKQFNDMMTQSQ